MFAFYLVLLLLIVQDNNVRAFTSFERGPINEARSSRTINHHYPHFFLPKNTALKSTATPSTSGDQSSTEDSFKAPQEEINRRRNLAIISHPDSGKTTMTEKLLLYGGALQQAGAVRQKAEQRATQSDFMAIEQERGISISSTVMNFDYSGYGIRLMDTPGHNDFRSVRAIVTLPCFSQMTMVSEDTYRALAAADNALMLLDGAKGLEPQTRKLFEVCRMRQVRVLWIETTLPSLTAKRSFPSLPL